MRYSEQLTYCKTCGAELRRKLAGIGIKDHCDMDCLKEWEWRHTLSLMGRDYYPRDQIGQCTCRGPQLGDAPNDPNCAIHKGHQ